jgi:hypothetical protein
MVVGPGRAAAGRIVASEFPIGPVAQATVTVGQDLSGPAMSPKRARSR